MFLLGLAILLIVFLPLILVGAMLATAAWTLALLLRRPALSVDHPDRASAAAAPARRAARIQRAEY